MLVNSDSRVSVSTCIVQVHRDSVQVVTRNLDTILEPNVVEISRGGKSRDGSLTAGADVSISGGSGNSCRMCVNRNQNRINHLATSVITGRRSGNRVLEVLRSRDSGNGGTRRSDKAFTFPSVNDVIIDETVEVSIQDNHFAFTNFHLVSSDLNVSTVGVDIEGLSGSTSTIGSGNRVSTGSRCLEDITSLTSISITFTPSISIGRRSSRNRSSSAVTNDVVARKRDFRSSKNFHLSIGF